MKHKLVLKDIFSDISDGCRKEFNSFLECSLCGTPFYIINASSMDWSNKVKPSTTMPVSQLPIAIRKVLDTVCHGQTLFGRMKQDGLGASAYRRARFLQIGSDAFVISWAQTFIKEFYPATLSKRGNRYSLVYDKRTSLILSSFKCWLSKRVEGEIPELETYFEQIDPQIELKELVRKCREAGAKLETIAFEFDISVYTASEWCKDIKVLSPTETEVIGLLENGQIWKTSDILTHSTFTRQAVTIALNSLLKKGFITKIKRGYYQKSGV